MNFDPVATVYDSTRGLPDWVSQAITERVVAITGANGQTRFLEIGVGTGRIALPFVEAGYSFTGVDISEGMMEQLRAKVPDAGNLTLVNASVTELPFPDDSFDVVLAVHILHLVPNWQRAVEEVRRVLTPDGFFVLGGNADVADTPGRDIRREWNRLVREAGHSVRPRYAEPNDVGAYLIEGDALAAEYLVASWEHSFAPRTLIDALHARVFSQAWDVPQDVLDTVDEQLRDWAAERYGNLDDPVSSRAEFMLQSYWWR